MALNQSALLELTEVLRSADEGQLMRSLLHTILQALIDAEAQAHIGAGLHERSEERLTQRNGTRAKTVSTAAGDLAVKIPKTRTGSFFPVVVASAAADRRGVACGGDGGLRARGLDPQGR